MEASRIRSLFLQRQVWQTQRLQQTNGPFVQVDTSWSWSRRYLACRSRNKVRVEFDVPVQKYIPYELCPRLQSCFRGIRRVVSTFCSALEPLRNKPTSSCSVASNRILTIMFNSCPMIVTSSYRPGSVSWYSELP